MPPRSTIARKKRSSKGLALLTKAEDKDARGLMFMLERVHGKSCQAIADEYNCSRSAVTTYIERVRNSGLLIERAKELIGERLVPLALAVYDAELKACNYEAAHDLLHGIGALNVQSTIKHAAVRAEDTLDSIRAEHAVDATIIPPALPPSPDEPKQLPLWSSPELPDSGQKDS